LSRVSQTKHTAGRRTDVLPPMNGLVDVGGECLKSCVIEFSRCIDATRYSIDQFMDLRAKAQDEVLGGIGPELVQTSGEFRRRPKRLSHGLKKRRVEVEVVEHCVLYRCDEWHDVERVVPPAQGLKSGLRLTLDTQPV
jgi:hypothetical protein